MITVHKEIFAACLEELQVLLPAHYEELALNKEYVPLDPQYEVYIEREKQGSLLFMVLREEGELAGYFIGFIAPGLHYRSCLTCITDIFYLRPKNRGRHAGKKLFVEVEKELRGRGVRRWFMGAKLHKDASFLFKQIGAEPVETTYSKWLGE